MSNNEQKRKYDKPELEIHGNLKKITEAKGRAGEDALGNLSR